MKIIKIDWNTLIQTQVFFYFYFFHFQFSTPGSPGSVKNGIPVKCRSQYVYHSKTDTYFLKQNNSLPKQLLKKLSDRSTIYTLKYTERVSKHD